MSYGDQFISFTLIALLNNLYTHNTNKHFAFITLTGFCLHLMLTALVAFIAFLFIETC